MKFCAECGTPVTESPEAGWWWLSFYDGGEFLGSTIVRGDGLVEAFKAAARIDACPDGEVHGWQLADGRVPEAQYRGRLLNPTEAEILIDEKGLR
jgi:hypothetical protein